MTQSLFGGFTLKLHRWWLETTGLPLERDDKAKNSDLLDALKECDPVGYGLFCNEVTAKLSETLTTETNWEQERFRERNIQEQRRLDKVGFNSDPLIPGNESFTNFRPRTEYPEVLQALEAAQRWARGAGPELLTLSGTPGGGKTHLALAAAREVMRRGRPVTYRTEGAILEALHSAMRQGEQGVEDVLAELLEIPVLVLDELGGQASSEWDKARMDRLIDARWRGCAAQMRTLITTNLVGDAMPARMASRLRDSRWGKVQIIRAADFRVTQA